MLMLYLFNMCSKNSYDDRMHNRYTTVQKFGGVKCFLKDVSYANPG